MLVLGPGIILTSGHKMIMGEKVQKESMNAISFLGNNENRGEDVVKKVGGKI